MGIKYSMEGFLNYKKNKYSGYLEARVYRSQYKREKTHIMVNTVHVSQGTIKLTYI